MIIEHLGKYRCVIRNRPSFNGRKLKDSAAAIDNETFDLTAMWLQDDDDPYPGEWAMGSIVSPSNLPDDISWISSGDIEIVGQLT